MSPNRSRPGHLRTAGRTAEDWELFSDWSDDIKKFLDWNLVADEAVILNAWQALDDYLEDMIARTAPYVDR